MGGYGSNRCGSYRQHTRVERCFAICAPTTRRSPDVLDGGRWVWPRSGLRVGYVGRGGALTLTFSVAGASHVQHIRLDATVPHYGGTRLWFLCPGCGRRSGRLYLPPRQDRFHCRQCHALSYESAQASRASYYDVFKSRVRHYGGTSRWVRELFREARGGGLAADMVGRLEIGRPSEKRCT